VVIFPERWNKSLRRSRNTEVPSKLQYRPLPISRDVEKNLKDLISLYPEGLPQNRLVALYNVSRPFKCLSREHYRGKYHFTIDLLFDWCGISCMTTDNFCFYLQLIQTSPTGSQRYSDTSPFSIPWFIPSF
jgi:hypothetical protein